MSNDGGKQSRDAAAGFGDATERGFGAIGDALDALNGKKGAADPRDDDDGGGDVNITVNR
ncbi:hypothetical protein [Leifsonia shinshuensis]|uniref:hypothetical protein n=1 Tax=Leifsonia shinshuensis TaxID=150026 RepID=UPI0028621CD9|nr:hypothetical protein [Leifsonia shinshuensis]MDR6971619.1 hypothetical protein [Leifsonia shinshuensis]